MKMKLLNTCPAWIKATTTEGEYIPGRSMLVIKETIAMSKPGTLKMMVLGKGMTSKVSARLMKKKAKWIKVSMIGTYLGPWGTKAGLENIDSVNLVLTNVEDIIPDAIEKYRKLELQHKMALRTIQQKDERIADMIEQIKAGNKDPILVARSEEVTGLSR